MRKNGSPQKIKAILFDLGKVLLDFNFEPAFKRLSHASGMPAHEISGFFTHSGLEVLYDGGKISSLEFHRAVKRGLNHPLSYDGFKKVWNNIFTPKREMINLVKRLSPHYRLVLISNTNSMHYEHIRLKYPVIRHFDKVILSFKEKIRKPDERIYKTAIKACQAKPAEILYIDDRDDLTDAAKSLGFHIFTFKNNPNELLQKMKELKIEKL